MQPARDGGSLEEGTALLDSQRFGTPSQPLDLGWVDLSDARISAYLQAVGDRLTIYRDSGLAPPLFPVAWALGQILQQAPLPPGAIHSLQEFDTLLPIRAGSSLRAFAWMERQRERAGLRFLTFAININTPQEDTAQSIRTTLMISSEAVAAPLDDPAARSRNSSSHGGDSEMAAVRRIIKQQQLAEYSAVSGDDNPLHLDAEFAAATQFGGIVAHGMLTLAFVSEMLTASLGELWLIGGSLRARFKGAAYAGDSVETWGRSGKPGGYSPSYTIGLLNSKTGEALITGTAAVKTNL